MLLLKGIFTKYLRCQNVLKMPTSLQSSLKSRNLIARNLICCANNKQNHIFHQKRNATENKGHRYRDERLQILPIYNEQYNYKQIHTSKPQLAIPPLIWLVAKPLAKMSSLLIGRYFRREMNREKLTFRERLHRARWVIGVGLTLLLGAGVIDYYTHLQETPITKRTRYLAFTPQQFYKIQQMELESYMQQLEGRFVDPTHPVYPVVLRVANEIVNANKDLDFFKNQKWQVAVIADDSFNAFVLPTGHIFVNSGVLRMVQNEDQLAVVIGHEMAHALLSHGIEKVGLAQLIDWFVIASMALIWFFMPSDGVALISQWFNNKVIQLLLDLPYSRFLELEADEVGLHLIAKACFDVREGPNLWNLLYILSQSDTKEDENPEVPEFLSTHPAFEKRASIYDTLLDDAVALRKSCKCAPLPKRDPRLDINYLKQLVKDAKQKRESVEAEMEPTPVIRGGPVAAALKPA